MPLTATVLRVLLFSILFSRDVESTNRLLCPAAAWLPIPLPNEASLFRYQLAGSGIRRYILHPAVHPGAMRLDPSAYQPKALERECGMNVAPDQLACPQPSVIYFRRGRSGTRAYAPEKGGSTVISEGGMLAMPDDAVTNGAAKRRRLAQRRKAVGLTQEQLAEQLGVERTTVVRWERGTTQPLPWLRPKLAKTLGVSADRIGELLAAGPAVRDGAALAVPRQLPAAVADFTGRAAELRALTAMLDRAGAGAPGTVVISAIGGTAGVGKTALALHWAHQAAERFPDGQLHVNLRGYDPTGIPVTPEAVIRGFLDALGVAPERIPRQLEAQAGLYRSLLADQRMLILLDNARDEQQVRPLLPASPGSLVLVTSRSQLGGLGAADGARLISLDVLSHTEAVQMLTARIGTARAGAEPGALNEIASLCACLPLALSIAAARAAASPGFPLAALAGELAHAAGRLDALDAGDPAASVRAVFSWSCRQLSAEAARTFGLLGSHPGRDISVPAAASLAGIAEADARRLLRELAHAHLIAEHLPGRYAFHDLLRAYAAEQAHHTGSDADLREATGRMLDHYLHTAARASRLLNIAEEPVVLAPPRPGAAAGQPADYSQARAWFEAEHQTLLAAVTLAAESGFDSHAWQLPWAMESFLRARGQRQERAATQRTALAAARRLGDAAAQALSSRLLALACTDLGDHDQARGHYASSLTLYQRLGNRLGEAKVQQNLGVLAAYQGRYADALGHAEQALRLYQAIGDKANEAVALNNAGWYHGQLGNYQQVRVFSRQALTLCAEVGHGPLEGCVWDSLGYAEHHLGNLAEAAACYQRALSFLQESGYRLLEADVLTHLGDARHALGELPQAREAWQQALAILEDLQHPGAGPIRAKLASTNPSQNPRS
jgi:tetratricopeptide (TPR) repeat protein/transcriptional regulator with XRE-family HTH domain